MAHSRKLAYLALLTNTIIWGGALPLVKPALEYSTPFQYLFYRYTIATLLIFPVLIITLYRSRPSITDLFRIILLESTVLILGHSLLYLGLARTTSLESSLLGISSPVFITLGGIFLLREKEQLRELIGLLIALSGTLLITLEPFFAGTNNFSGNFSGNLLVLGYVLIWVTYNLIAKRFYSRIPNKLFITALGTTVAAPALGLISFFTTPQSTDLASFVSHSLHILSLPSVAFASFYMAILGTLIAIPLYTFGLSQIEASEAALFTYLQPLISIPLAIFWLQESITVLAIIGLCFIAIGVVIAETRPRPSKSPYPPHTLQKHPLS